MISSQPRWVLATSLLVALLNAADSFHVAPRVLPILSTSRGPSQQRLTLDQESLKSWRDYQTRNDPQRTRLRSAEEESNEPEESASSSDNSSYEGLYEFLTRRTGEQAGESERRRKRDRIRDWMTSSPSSSSSNTGNGGSNLVRPIRMEDGSIMEEDPPRVQARFDKLFSGMPSLDEILSRNEGASQNEDSSELSSSDDETRSKSRARSDDSWFAEEKKQIEAEYEKVIDDLKKQIRQQREEDPDSMPENAEGVAESIARQDLERKLTSIKLARAKERLEQYEINKMSELDSRDMTGVTDEVVERMLKESTEEWKRQQALQAEVEDFLRYESEARASLSDTNVPAPGSDLDVWALERLEDMLKTTQKKASESGAAVSDIIEQQIEDLREQIEKEAKKGSIKPQTMKEWQMYRAIATRLGRERGFDPKLDAALNLAELDEQQVAQRLNSWKEYVDKEEEIRNRSGLSVGIRMPFDWQKANKTPGEDQVPKSAVQGEPGSLSRREMRRDVNMKALQAFEALVEKSDPARSERLKKQLEALRMQLEPLDYVDVEEEVQEQKPVGPVDLSDLFGIREKDESKLTSSLYEEEKDVIDRVLASDATSIYASDEEIVVPQAPPDTPFFSDQLDDERKPPPPKTPFFDPSYDKASETVDIENTKLGSADDQKLLNMFRKAGARTKEEQDAIREQWEAFQALEKAKRDESGLSDDDQSAVLEKANLKYDLSEVMTSDGDFDAEKVLSSIGPRPTRKKKDLSQAQKPEDSRTNEESKSGLDPAQVSESLFRSVAAVGGGRIKEAPETRESQKASFEDYLKKEEELRRSLDDLDENAKKLAMESDIPIDDASYAQDVLASIGPRPVFKKRKKETVDEKQLSDRGGIAASDDDSDDEDDSDEDEPLDDISSSSVDLVPDWLKKERKAMQKKDGYDSISGFSGRNIDEVFDDDQYDHNLRQLHEYEERRSGRQKQMGIDISDVLGSRARGSDDYADYSFDTDYFRGRQRDWGATSFDARKANLLDYVELSVPELNNLMDHRDSVYATGVSQYLPRINKPFKEFGAIFRLEGVLLDLTGLHEVVWKKVATEFKFKEPILEDIRRAAVVRPEVAIREVFFWTNDVFVVREAIACFRRVFREVFDEWAAGQGLSDDLPKIEPGKGSMALGSELDSEGTQMPASPTRPVRVEGEQSRLKRIQEAWLRTAQELELSIPTNEQIAQSTFLSPEIAVREVFRWTSDRQDIDAVVSVYGAILSGNVDGSKTASTEYGGTAQRKQNESSLLESQYKAWTKVAEGGSFEPPKPEEVLAAAVLNDPEAVIIKGFGWTDDVAEAHGLAQLYRDYLRGFMNGQEQPQASIPSPPVAAETKKPVESSQGGPTDEEVLETQIKAWAEAASTHRFSPPRPDQIQLTMNLSASDAVRRLLGWTYNFNEGQICEITETYEKALTKASEKYVKAYDLEVTKVEPPRVEPCKKGKELTGDELYQAAFDSWTNVAWQSGFSLPDQEQVQFAMAVGPEEAIVNGFEWTDSYETATEIANKYRDQIQLKRAEWVKKGYDLSFTSTWSSEQQAEAQPMVAVMPGAAEWIKSLLEVEMACGVVSYLDEGQVHILLKYAGLADLVPREKRVSLTNGYDRDSQQMLGVALRIERRPDHCVVFDTSPGASGAAHEVDMRSVAMVGPYPRYELLSADSSAVSFDELTAMNIRRLFGERIYDQPMLDMLQNQPENTRKTKTKFWDDE